MLTHIHLLEDKNVFKLFVGTEEPSMVQRNSIAIKKKQQDVPNVPVCIVYTGICIYYKH